MAHCHAHACLPTLLLTTILDHSILAPLRAYCTTCTLACLLRLVVVLSACSRRKIAPSRATPDAYALCACAAACSCALARAPAHIRCHGTIAARFNRYGLTPSLRAKSPCRRSNHLSMHC
jgi:hypothetical protein